MYLVKWNDPNWGKIDEKFFFEASAKERAAELRGMGFKARVSADSTTRRIRKEAKERAVRGPARRIYVGD